MPNNLNEDRSLIFLGILSILSIFGIAYLYKKYKNPSIGSIEEDWKIIGNDINKSIETWKVQRLSKTIPKYKESDHAEFAKWFNQNLPSEKEEYRERLKIAKLNLERFKAFQQNERREALKASTSED